MEHWLFIQIASKRPLPTSQKTDYHTIMQLKLSLFFREIITICSENNKVHRARCSVLKVAAGGMGYTIGIQTFYGTGSHATLWAVGGPSC
jgi:hypothetical protein